jgi:predicted Zn-dependent protease
LIDALVASGTKAMAGYHWGGVMRRAREAVALVEPGAASRGAHALLADALFAFNDFENAIAEYQRALVEAPRDQRLRRHLARARQQAQTRAAVAAARSGAGAPALSGAGTPTSPSESPSLPMREPRAE